MIPSLHTNWTLSKPQTFLSHYNTNTHTLPRSCSLRLSGSRSERKQRTGYWLTQTMKLLSRTHNNLLTGVWPPIIRGTKTHAAYTHTVPSDDPPCSQISSYFYQESRSKPCGLSSQNHLCWQTMFAGTRSLCSFLYNSTLLNHINSDVRAELIVLRVTVDGVADWDSLFFQFLKWTCRHFVWLRSCSFHRAWLHFHTCAHVLSVLLQGVLLFKVMHALQHTSETGSMCCQVMFNSTKFL